MNENRASAAETLHNQRKTCSRESFFSRQVMQAFHSHDEGTEKEHYEALIWLLTTTQLVFCYSFFCAMKMRGSFCFL
jgi:hypothetical protein